MAVSYEEAREIIRARFEPVFEVGAREYLVDGDFDYAIAGGVPIVYKSGGRIDGRASVAVAMDPTIRVRPNPNPTLTV